MRGTSSDRLNAVPQTSSYPIPFNWPWQTGHEIEYIAEVIGPVTFLAMVRSLVAVRTFCEMILARTYRSSRHRARTLWKCAHSCLTSSLEMK